MMNENEMYLLCQALRRVLRDSPELRQSKYLVQKHPMAGFSYVASEALYHLGAREAGFIPVTLRVGDDVHWYLRHPDGRLLDPTADQFREHPPSLLERRSARGRGFLTRHPSKRCRIALERLDEMRRATPPGTTRDALNVAMEHHERRTT